MKKFGTFELNIRGRELRKSGARIKLQDQPFEILSMMLDRPGDVITREELRERLWPAGTFVDFEHSLNAAVKRLRAALGDDADNPRFIETLHRRGYRFIAPVESSENGNGARPQVSRAADGGATRPAATHGLAPNLRLVVLPFANLSQDPEQDYFSDGLTEEMITQIARLCPGRLAVIARTSSMSLKGTAKGAAEIGHQFGVDYLLQGCVRRESDRIRITAQLIEARTESHLWAETYDRKLEESLMLQSDVAARIARSLAMELVPDQRDAIARVSPRQNEAYQAYLKGRFHWNRTGDQGLKPALMYYQRAIDLDPNFASAHAAMARAHLALAKFSHEAGRDAIPRARASALRALELDPGDSDAHVVLANALEILDWNWPGAEAEYRRAIELAPSCYLAHRLYGEYLAAMSRHAEARVEVARAATLDPICLAANTATAWVRFVSREFDEAIEHCVHTLELEPSYTFARRLLGAAYITAGLYEDGIAELEKAAGQDCAHAVSCAWLAHGKAAAGHHEDARGLLRHLEGAGRRYVPAYHKALAYAALGEKDRAFELLATACEERDPAIRNVSVDPRFEPLSGDPRFGALLRGLRLQ